MTEFVKRRRADREALMRASAGADFETAFTHLESWDVDLGSFQASVIVGHENVGTDEDPHWRWHISVAGKHRVPDWGEFAAIVHEIRPGVVFCMPLPPRSWWINISETCLHAWEISDPPLEDQWRAERRGDTPS